MWHEPAALKSPPEGDEPVEAEVELPDAEQPKTEVAFDQVEPEPAQVEPEPVSTVEPKPAEPYRIDDWCGKPNYGCPWCPFKTLDGPGAVELHILETLDRGNVKHLAALEKHTGGS